ncbi:hypothetical protein Dsin_026881 [Dipteronia sinensis]|uniref:Uncharacterized protein n=1 Tax=Dipteronia sinensis TaxID=43782 RepID=A0AAE0DYI8_9ROSI|nr:hypothetical protein Dsin_026881 [Dipteronia sinensis]
MTISSEHQVELASHNRPIAAPRRPLVGFCYEKPIQQGMKCQCCHGNHVITLLTSMISNGSLCISPTASIPYHLLKCSLPICSSSTGRRRLLQLAAVIFFSWSPPPSSSSSAGRRHLRRLLVVPFFSQLLSSFKNSGAVKKVFGGYGFCLKGKHQH